MRSVAPTALGAMTAAKKAMKRQKEKRKAMLSLLRRRFNIP
jgi:hypothetical protein